MKIKTTTLDKIAALLFIALLTVATLCLGINTKRGQTLFPHKEQAPTSPYQLISFSAQQKDNNKYLSWSMTSIHNNFYFALERSADGEHYFVVDLKRGAASPIRGQELRYSFIDRESVSSEKIYYRLRLLEIQATDMANKKAILSEEDMFQNNPMAAITLINKQTLTK